MPPSKPEKPYRLRRWRLRGPEEAIDFYTCARPGRSSNSASRQAPVPDKTVSAWVLGLPGPKTAIISLLGAKPDGMSEYSFYSFSGGYDGEESPKPRFKIWLNDRHADLGIQVIEHPTVDFQPVPAQTIRDVLEDLRKLASSGRTAILIDSGGETRTGAVCRGIGATEAFG